jgi:hypothetical protein
MKVAALAALAGPVCMLLAACSEASSPMEAESGLRPQMAASTFHENLSVPFFGAAFVSCANDGAGDFVVLSGDLHVLTQITFDNRGGLHVTVHANPQNVAGVGETSGTPYRAVGVSSNKFTGKVGLTNTSINNFRVIGKGVGNNLQIHQNFHMTVNANGQLTTLFENASFECN